MNSKNLRMNLLKAQNNTSGKSKNSNFGIVEISSLFFLPVIPVVLPAWQADRESASAI
jgi:hypothetical protein